MTDFLRNSIIVAAHPDDEMLWFTSIVKDVDSILLVYEDAWPTPELGPARARALETFPRNTIENLRLPEAATYGCADWANPQPDDFGIAFGATATLRDAKHTVLRQMGMSEAPPEGIAGKYQENFDVLVTALRRFLKFDMNVFTHNPWGEYGHEDHLQVFRAVESLRAEIGFTQWMSNYCTERTLPLAMRYFDNEEREIIQRKADKAFAEEIADCYRKAGAWTWSDQWVWFDTEHFCRVPDGPAEPQQQANLMPLNMFVIG